MKKAQIGGSWDVLPRDDLERIHRASLSLLAEPGIFSFFPVLFRRQTIDQWKDHGAKSILEVAHERVRAILEQPAPVLISAQAEQALDEVLAGVTTQPIG